MSWEDKQIGAVLVVCAKCGQPYYMTKPQPLCKGCRG